MPKLILILSAVFVLAAVGLLLRLTRRPARPGHCPECGHALPNIASPRCPACGESI